MANVSVASERVADISAPLMQRMKEIFLQNVAGILKDQPLAEAGDREQQKQAFLAEFEEHLQSPTARVHMMTHDGTLGAFFLADVHEDTVDFSGFNTDPAVQGVAMGYAMFDRAVEEYVQKNLRLRLSALPSMAKSYMPRWHLHVTGEEKFAGMTYLLLERDARTKTASDMRVAA